ncbi:hypothetical protein T484DRAFT_1921148 [Baffinella frigidus]|nr:hypothetical protein T484DRAFT_1921148 [Cryptophyta sp. CCMP2293]
MALRGGGGGSWNPFHQGPRTPLVEGLVDLARTKPAGVLADSGANTGVYYDPRFFDPATLRVCMGKVTGVHGSTPPQEYTYGTVHFVLEGDRGDKVAFTIPDQLYMPTGSCNIVATGDLNAAGLATVLCPDKAQSGLWYDFNTPTARKFATFVWMNNSHNQLPFLRTCEMGAPAKTSITQRLAWLLKTTLPYVWAVFYGVGCGVLGGWWCSRG